MGVCVRLVAHVTTQHPPKSHPNQKKYVCVCTHVHHHNTTTPPRVHQHVHVRSYVRTDEYLTNSSKQALLVPLTRAPARVLLLKTLQKQTRGLGLWAHNLLEGDIPINRAPGRPLLC